MCAAPLVALNAGPPPNPQIRCHGMALAHGLPEIPGYYGIDLTTGEFIRS